MLSPTLEKQNPTGFAAAPGKRPLEALALIAFFVGLLAWFSFGTLITSLRPISTVSLSEKRMLAPLPHLNLNLKSASTFPAKFELYLNDHLIDRDWLISQLCWGRFSLFDLATGNKALVGKDGWLYLYFNGDKETLEKSPPFSKPELNALTRIIQQRNEWATKHGIKYLFVMTPSKCSVYPEFLDHPERQRGTISRREQLFEALHAEPGLEALDLAPVLASHKQSEQLYLKTDTHWNDRGAFYGYEAIMDRLRKWFPGIRPVSKLTPGPTLSYCGDLAKYLGLDGMLFESVPRLTFTRTSRFSSSPPPPDLNDPLQDHHPFATEKPNSGLPRLFCLRDSFMIAPQPYFSENFSRAYFSWSQDFESQKILSEHPDVIIDEMTERLLYWPLPLNVLTTPELGTADLGTANPRTANLRTANPRTANAQKTNPPTTNLRTPNPQTAGEKGRK